jgi:hypothetical protein
MALSAEHVIEMWLNAQSGLPHGWTIVPSKGIGRFKVVWKHPCYDIPFTLFILRVTSLGAVVVLKDMCQRVRDSLVEHPEGFAREKRVFDALAVHAPETPVWFNYAERSREFHDNRGIDGFVNAIVGRRTENIPLQIKSSKGGIVRYFEKYPEYKGRIAVVRVTDDLCAKAIRLRVYSAVGTIRTQIAIGASNLRATMRMVNALGTTR